MLVILVASSNHVPLAQILPGNHLSLIALWAAAVVYVVIGWLLLRRYIYLLTPFAVLMVTLLYFSVTYALFPNIVLLGNGTTLSLTSVANWSSITALGWALLIGSLLIFPSLFYLIYIFEGRTKQPKL